MNLPVLLELEEPVISTQIHNLFEPVWFKATDFYLSRIWKYD